MADRPALIISWVQIAKRQWWIVLAAAAVGFAGGFGASQTVEVEYVASGHVRVGLFEAETEVVDPPTAAFEASAAAFQKRMKQTAGVDGRLAFRALYRTDIVQVRAWADTPEAAEKLVDVTTSIMVEEQNHLIEQIVDGAYARASKFEGQALVDPVVFRPAARLSPVNEARPDLPKGRAWAAGGLALGLLLGAGLAGLREATRAT